MLVISEPAGGCRSSRPLSQSRSQHAARCAVRFGVSVFLLARPRHPAHESHRAGGAAQPHCCRPSVDDSERARTASSASSNCVSVTGAARWGIRAGWIPAPAAVSDAGSNKSGLTELHGEDTVADFGNLNGSAVAQLNGLGNRMEVGFAHSQRLAGDIAIVHGGLQGQQAFTTAGDDILPHMLMPMPVIEAGRGERVAPAHAPPRQARSPAWRRHRSEFLVSGDAGLPHPVDGTLELPAWCLDANRLHDDARLPSLDACGSGGRGAVEQLAGLHDRRAMKGERKENDGGQSTGHRSRKQGAHLRHRKIGKPIGEPLPPGTAGLSVCGERERLWRLVRRGVFGKLLQVGGCW